MAGSERNEDKGQGMDRERKWVNESREGVRSGEVTRAHASQATALQWGGTDDTRYRAYLMAESAGELRALHGAAREIPQYQSSHSAPMLLAFAMERALKAWHLRTTGEAAKRTHRLLELYEALPEEVQECLDETAGAALRPYLSKTGSGRSRLAEVLEAHDTAFHDWRYPEEVLADPERPNGLFFETGEYEAALDGVLEAFDRPAKNGVRVAHMGTLGNAGARTTMRTRD